MFIQFSLIIFFTYPISQTKANVPRDTWIYVERYHSNNTSESNNDTTINTANAAATQQKNSKNNNGKSAINSKDNDEDKGNKAKNK